MSKIYLLIVAICCIEKGRAQDCATIPLYYSYDSLEFTTSDGFGDSMFTFNILNEHPTQGFAYPQARLEALTPLPAGMTLNPINDPWAVFGSSWNPGQHLPVRIYYDVAEPIPVDYTVLFTLKINNLTPITDSCYFNAEISVNLNPSQTIAISQLQEPVISVSPNPSHDGNFIFENTTNSVAEFIIYNLSGAVLQTGSIAPNERYDQQLVNNGIYLLKIHSCKLNQTIKLIKL